MANELSPTEQALRDAAREYHRTPTRGKIAAPKRMADFPEKVPCWTWKSERHAHNFEMINGNIQAFYIARMAINLLQYFHIKPSFTRSGARHDSRGKQKRQPEAKHLELRQA